MKRTLTGSDAFIKMLSIPLPEKTKTYTPIAHMHIVNRVRSEIRNAGFSIEAESFKCSQDGMVALGSMMINYKDDPKLVLAANFVNSYNKQFAFRFSLGGVDKTTGSYMILDDNTYGSYKRVHKGAADLLAEGKIQETINGAGAYWKELLDSADLLSAYSVGLKSAYSYAAELFFKDDAILNTMQLNTIKTLFKAHADKTVFINLYDFHNIIGQALQDSHPSEWLDHQTKLHSYLMEKARPCELEDAVESIVEEETAELSEAKDDTYRLPTQEEWEEATSTNIIDELP
jgi:hypothetical protein